MHEVNRSGADSSGYSCADDNARELNAIRNDERSLEYCGIDHFPTVRAPAEQKDDVFGC
jgi:hypothetical protein